MTHTNAQRNRQRRIKLRQSAAGHAKKLTVLVWGKSFASLTLCERKELIQFSQIASYHRFGRVRQARLRRNKSTPCKKQRILTALGIPTRCERCGYDKCIGALDFHHRDSRTKIGSVITLPFALSIKEAKKCDVLCANCHREHHHTTNRSSKSVNPQLGRPKKKMSPDAIDRLKTYLRLSGGLTEDITAECLSGR